MKVALLEDNAQQAELVSKWLEESGFIVSRHADCRSFLKSFKADVFDLAILDWELPDQSGIEVLTQLRVAQAQTLPIIFTTQRDSEEDIVHALKSGADDYLIKPLRKAELLARMEAVRRRTGLSLSNSDTFKIADIEIDTRKKQIYIDRKEVKVTPKEFGVALELVKHQGQVLSREYLLERVWGVNADIHTRTVDMHVSRVRRNLNINPDMGYRISTIFQHGYRLEKIES